MSVSGHALFLILYPLNPNKLGILPFFRVTYLFFVWNFRLGKKSYYWSELEEACFVREFSEKNRYYAPQIPAYVYLTGAAWLHPTVFTLIKKLRHLTVAVLTDKVRSGLAFTLVNLWKKWFILFQSPLMHSERSCLRTKRLFTCMICIIFFSSKGWELITTIKLFLDSPTFLLWLFIVKAKIDQRRSI